jgi:hypothetical protein
MGSAVHRETGAKWCEPPRHKTDDGIKGKEHRIERPMERRPFWTPAPNQNKNKKQTNQVVNRPSEMMKSAVETQPFLAFADDPAAQQGASSGDGSLLPPHREALVKASGTRRVVRDISVCLATSLVWVLILWVVTHDSSPTRSSGSSSAPCSMSSSPAGDDAPSHQMPSQGSSSVITGEDTARYHNITSGATYISCGTSAEEARSEGCTYDTLLNAWVPAQCLDQEWIDEYQDDASWTAFAEYVVPMVFFS